MAVLLGILVVLLFVLGSGIRLLMDAMKSNVPGPWPLPLFGNGLLFLGDSAKFMDSLYELSTIYGDIFRVHILSDRYMVLSNPKYVEPIISSSEHINKGVAYYYLQPWLGLGLLTSGGQKWRTHRKFLTPAFHFNILQTFMPIFLKNEKVLINKLIRLADGKPFDLFPIMALVALDNMTETAMGVSINAQEDSDSEYVQAVHDISEITSMRMRNPIVGSDLIFNLLPMKTKQNKALTILHGQTNKVIRDRRHLLKEQNITLNNYDSFGVKQKCAFLDLLLLSEVDGLKLDNESIREEVDTFMFEGHDTTTSALSFTLYCISKHRHVQEKLFQEQRDLFFDDLQKDPTYIDLQHMKYLELVIKESLRLYPSVPLIARRITQETVIYDYIIPKGTTVTINIMNMQRSKTAFDDPEEFRPERFESSHQKSVYSWVAFSAGPRNCIGQRFAMTQMKMILSSIIRKFNILPSGMEPKLCADLILRSQNGVHIKLTPRPLID